MRKIDRIFVHCTASAQSWGVRELKDEFRRKGWNNPGYHYAVTQDGVAHELLAEGEVANGVKGYNAHSIHVAYVGGIRGKDGKLVGVDNRTPAQKATLRMLLQTLRVRYPEARILGHRDIWGKSPEKWQKECPCFDAEVEYGDI